MDLFEERWRKAKKQIHWWRDGALTRNALAPPYDAYTYSFKVVFDIVSLMVIDSKKKKQKKSM